MQIGSKQRGQVQIVSGLQGGETIALDGAGFLSDGAAVNIKADAKAAAAGAPKQQ